MEAEVPAVLEVRSSSKSHMQNLSCGEGLQGHGLSPGAAMLDATPLSFLVYMTQVPAVNTTCLAWLQQQMQMVGVIWHLTLHSSCLLLHIIACLVLCSWLQTQLTQQNGLPQSGILQSICL